MPCENRAAFYDEITIIIFIPSVDYVCFKSLNEKIFMKMKIEFQLLNILSGTSSLKFA